MTADRAVPGHIIACAVDLFVCRASADDDVPLAPVEQLRGAAVALTRVVKVDLHHAERVVADEFLQRLELRFCGQDNGGRAGECIRHARTQIEDAFRFLN